MHKFSSIIGDLKEQDSTNIQTLADIVNVTNNDLCNFIESKSLANSQTNKCFVEIYESFESALKQLTEFIHYKKPQLVFNKENNTINGSTILKLLQNENEMELLVRDHINTNVNKIMYGKNIVDILKFIKNILSPIYQIN